ncbi:MAG: hypothetical protein ABIU09_10320 [Pyrinomonadaceae bacterium]
MMYQRMFAAVLAVFFLVSAAAAQKPELTITLNEPFFDALLDSVFKNFDPPEFPIALNGRDGGRRPSNGSAFAPAAACKESIQLLRENNGVRSAVRFRDGRILAPLAFSGNYSPPFIGCVSFSGFAETSIELDFDQDTQRLTARAKVLNVSLNGTAGLGGSVIAKLVQSSIDRKINPIEIIRMDKLSFLLPIQNGANLRMKATGVRHDIENGALRIHISYEFLKG